MNEETPLFNELLPIAYNDPIVYGWMQKQAQDGMSDRDVLIAIVKEMAERHAYVMRQNQNLLARMPSVFTMNIGI